MTADAPYDYGRMADGTPRYQVWRFFFPQGAKINFVDVDNQHFEWEPPEELEAGWWLLRAYEETGRFFKLTDPTGAGVN